MSLWRETLSEEEITEATSRARTNKKAIEVYETLKRFKDISFEEGDFLLRYDAQYNWDSDLEDKKTWKIERFSDTNDSYRKYKVVHVDEVGLPYVQKVLFNGNMSGEAKCLAGYDLDWTKFLPDPDFLDHHLLMEEEDVFDPLNAYKERKGDRKRKTK
jgi:hypothetical protein